VEQHCELSSYSNDGAVSGLFTSTRCKMQAPLSQAGVLSVAPEHMVGTLDKQRSKIDIAGLSDAELRISLPGLTAPRSQSQITTYVPTSLEPFFAAQGQHIRQRRKLPDAVDLAHTTCFKGRSLAPQSQGTPSRSAF
jgi:hypothetical protein